MSLSNKFSYPDQLHEKTLTMRNPSEAVLLISSNDRFTLDGRTGLYDYNSENGRANNYNISTQKLQGFGEIKRIGISEVSFPWVIPNVNERNNLFIIKGQNGIPYYTVITEGFYYPDDLATALQNNLNNLLYNALTNSLDAYGVWTVSHANNIFTISNASPWMPSLKPLGINFSGNHLSYLNYVINITPLDFGQSNFVNTYSGGYASMAYTRYVDICSDALCKFQPLKDSLTQQSHTNVLCRIYINNGSINIPNNSISQAGNFEFGVKYNNVKWIAWNPDNMIGSFDIKYYDDSGNLLYIPDKDQGTAQYFTMLMSES
jgi:hypothetical protein